MGGELLRSRLPRNFLAYSVLQVLAEDPETLKAIETLASVPPYSAATFDLGISIGLTTAVLIVLQTRVQFKRDSTGKWSLKLDKKPTSDALLKGLVQKLIGFVK
jgi:hypothetical protein